LQGTEKLTRGARQRITEYTTLLLDRGTNQRTLTCVPRDLNPVIITLLSVAAEAGDRAVRFDRALADLLAVSTEGKEIDANYWALRIADEAHLCGEEERPSPFEPCCLFAGHGGHHLCGPRALEISERERILARSSRPALIS
jgi:hypothetical protein